MNKLQLIAIFLLLSFMPIAFAQETRTVTVGETTVEYVLPAPPQLTLTTPSILQNPPATARVHPMLRFDPAPFNGVLYNEASNAWLTVEIQNIPYALRVYSDAIQAQMVAWTYLQIEQDNLRLATEQETARIEVAGLRREIDSIRRLRKRNVLRAVLITGGIMLTTAVIGTSAGYIVGRNQ